MANAKKCDRCGKLYEPYSVWSGGNASTDHVGKPNAIIFARLNNDNSRFCVAEYKGLKSTGYKTRDLCPDCMGELLEWWSEK